MSQNDDYQILRKELTNIRRILTLAALTFFMITGSVRAVQYVTPSGECMGVKIYTQGLIVTDTVTLTDLNGKEINLAAGYGIEKGDIIKSIDGKPAVSNSYLAECVNNCQNNLTLTIERHGSNRDIALTPIETSDGKKLGLWLRDSTAGLGTITCSIGNKFIALGHGICDIDTGNIMPVERGIIQECTITSIEKGKNGSPGAIGGSIDGKEMGVITENTAHGLRGSFYEPQKENPIPVLDKTEVKTGAATILADVDGSGVKEYAIEIKRIAPIYSGGKDMVIKVTDKRLIEKTGGIVQGMSGAPILQNNAFVGAVTHVFINDSLSGYGILAEKLLE